MGAIALSVAVAAAIAVYESPELRRMADDLRRRIAIALHSLGDGIHPQNENPEPLFNRPEDAEGFLRSQGVPVGAGNADVEADDETRRRQREELLYWNRLHMEKKEKEKQEMTDMSSCSQTLGTPHRGLSFDDFLAADQSGEKGTYVFNTGADVRDADDGLVRRRGVEGVRGLNSSMYANPFGDEHGIDMDEHPILEPAPLTPGRDEIMSDIYYSTPAAILSPQLTAEPAPVSVAAAGDVLFDASEHPQTRSTDGAQLLERELSQDEYMTAGQDDRNDAFASIQAWAQNSNASFYSPLPLSPAAPLSEPEIISDGSLTPTDSASSAGSGEDIAKDAVSERSATEGRDYDVLSDDEDGIPTPNSWSEVGSVVSESDAGAAHR